MRAAIWRLSKSIRKVSWISSESLLVKETNMKTLKRFSSVLVLSSVLGGLVLAGEMPTPPCAPGEMNTALCGAR